MINKYTFNIILFNPLIPPNTGNIIRLCANTGSRLHLIKPLGFSLNEKSLRRAGMDYFKKVDMNLYENVDDFLQNIKNKKIFLITKSGNQTYEKPKYIFGDYFLFGSETSGLPDYVYEKLKDSPRISIPMVCGNRSLNLANAVSICIYEAWRQNNFLFP